MLLTKLLVLDLTEFFEFRFIQDFTRSERELVYLVLKALLLIDFEHFHLILWLVPCKSISIDLKLFVRRSSIGCGGLELSKIFSLSLKCRTRWKMSRNIFYFAVSLLELHCVRILCANAQFCPCYKFSIRICRALLNINIFTHDIRSNWLFIWLFVKINFLTNFSCILLPRLMLGLVAVHVFHWCLLSSQDVAWGSQTILFLVFYFLVGPILPFLVITFSILRCLKIKGLIRFFRPHQSIISFLLLHRRHPISILALTSSSDPRIAIRSDKSNLSFESRTHIEIFCKFELLLFFWVRNIGILILCGLIST